LTGRGDTPRPQTRCRLARTPTPPFHAKEALDVIRSRLKHSPRARAKAPPATLEQKLQALGELVDGLGVAGPLPHPVGGEAETEATSA
jgi:hypothetical protein